MRNEEAIQYLLRVVDNLDEMQTHYKDSRRIASEINVARQCVYDCAMEIQLRCREGKADE